MPDSVRMHVDGLAGATRAFHSAPLVLTARIRGTTRKYGQQLLRQVRANASGRSGVTFTPPDGGPSGEIGPRFQSGDYRRSIGLENGLLDGDPYAEVGSSAPQARRLELGFVGQDSLSRHYSQPPFPHYRPALEKVAPEYVAAVDQDFVAVDRIIGAGR